MSRPSPLTILSLTTLALSTSVLAETKVDFVQDVKPIFEAACINCHGPEEEEGEFRMDTKAAAFKGNYNGAGIVPGDPDESPVYWTTTLPKDDDLVMPPKKQLTAEQQEVIKAWIEQGAEWPEKVVLQETPRMDFKVNIEPLFAKGGPFTAKELELIRLWADQGAVWPEGFKLGGEPEDEGGLKDDLELVKVIREKVMENSPEIPEAEMEAYTSTIPKTGVEFSMVPIPGGTFMMGSPEGEAERKDDEGPQRKVQLEPFWMGKFEVTWDEYEPFMITDVARRKDGSPEKIAPDADPVDVVSSPTTPYTEMSFGMGVRGFPAISMTQHAALKYCQWLSAQTGHYYRLPTEAEWEYACRAGTTTRFHWGDSTDKIDEYAWYYDNAEDKYQLVGQKKPNPWGLYDMHGNVIEWTLDAYQPSYPDLGELVISPYVKPGTDLYPRVARGGSWYDDPKDLRSAVRFRSSAAWKIQDPQLPKSIWYHTDGEWLGFRLVRPLKVPPATKMHEIWNSGRGEENQ